MFGVGLRTGIYTFIYTYIVYIPYIYLYRVSGNSGLAKNCDNKRCVKLDWG